MKTHLLLGSALLLLVAPDIALAQDHARPAPGGGHGRPPVTKPVPPRPGPSRPRRDPARAAPPSSRRAR